LICSSCHCTSDCRANLLRCSKQDSKCMRRWIEAPIDTEICFDETCSFERGCCGATDSCVTVASCPRSRQRRESQELATDTSAVGSCDRQSAVFNDCRRQVALPRPVQSSWMLQMLLLRFTNYPVRVHWHAQKNFQGMAKALQHPSFSTSNRRTIFTALTHVVHWCPEISNIQEHLWWKKAKYDGRTWIVNGLQLNA